jgi:hypothetical protein
MSCSAAIHIVSPAEFDRATAQTPASERRAAIAPALGIASTIWGGLFEVEPGSRTGIHHQGNRRRSRTFFPASARFAGAKEEKRPLVQRPEILFMSPLSCRIWKSILQSRSRFDGLSYEALQCPSSSIFLTTPGRKPDVSELRDGVWP